MFVNSFAALDVSSSVFSLPLQSIWQYETRPLTSVEIPEISVVFVRKKKHIPGRHRHERTCTHTHTLMRARTQTHTHAHRRACTHTPAQVPNAISNSSGAGGRQGLIEMKHGALRVTTWAWLSALQAPSSLKLNPTSDHSLPPREGEREREQYFNSLLFAIHHRLLTAICAVKLLLPGRKTGILQSNCLKE